MDVIPNILVTRERVRAEFAKCVSKATAKDLESFIMEWSKNYDVDSGASTTIHELYETKTKDLLHAIQTDPALVEKYQPSVIVVLDPSQLVVDAKTQERNSDADVDAGQTGQAMDIDKLINEDEEMPEEDRKRMEGQYMKVCKRCHSKNIVWDLKQIRGADEPMTAFFKCRDCAARWKE